MKKLICNLLLIFIIHSTSFGLMSGTYTVGGVNPNFTTISQAIAVLDSGVSGPVIINIRPGIYDDNYLQINNNIPGATLINSITIQSETHINTDVTIMDHTTNWAFEFSACCLIIKDLTFKGTCHFDWGGYNTFKNNIIIGDSSNFISVAYGEKYYFYNNTFYIDFQLDYSTNDIIANNKFYKNIDVSFGNSNMIANNYINNYFDDYWDDYDVFIYNNFGPDPKGYFHNESSHNSIENNIMPAIVRETASTSIYGFNDYPFGSGTLDLHPYFIDPKYISPANLQATNVQLIGKATNYFSSINYDINNHYRSNAPTVGANEICMQDTVNASCGDSLIISLCSMPATGNFVWYPLTGINNTNHAHPKLGAYISKWYYVKDTITGYKDSIYIKVNNNNVFAGNDDSIKYCGYGIMLYASYVETAIYNWTPTDSLSTPNSYNTFANPSQTTSYIVTSTVPGCGVSSDTITIFVNPLPYAFTYIANNSLYNNICFQNASTCADTYYWDFGDSTYSILVNPCHIYNHTGNILITLIACNSFGCDTIRGNVIVDSVVSVNEIKLEKVILKVFPNPSTNKTTITYPQLINEGEILIYNTLGQMMYKEKLAKASTQKEINIQNFKTGLYKLILKEKGIIKGQVSLIKN